jgi:lysophospholipase L1-like esterase
MKVAFLRRPGRTAALGAVGLVVLAAIVLGMWRPWSPLPAAAPVGAGEDAVIAAPSALVLPENPRVLVFGDSWTYGSAATAPTDGYAYVLAYLLKGETVVNGVRGSGYLKPGLDGPTFGERIAALDPSLDPDLVIIQGSINDRLMGETGYREAVNAAWDALVALYPDATIVVLGPAPHELPVGAGTARIDTDLAELAAARGWWYISPIDRGWITEQNYLSVIDVSVIGNKHPSTAGHRYLAEQLAAALNELSGAPVTEAGESETTPDQ